MVKKEKDPSSLSQMEINKIFLEAVTKLKNSEVSISKVRAYILKHHDIDIMNKLKDLKMQTRNRDATVSSHNPKKVAVSTMSIKAKTAVLKTVNLLKQSKLKDKSKPNDKTQEKKIVGKASSKKGDTKVKAIATVLSQDSKKGVVSTLSTKAKSGGLKDVKEVKKQSKIQSTEKSNEKTRVKIEVGISSKDKKSSVVKVEKALKVKKRMSSKVPEKKLISVPETIPENKKDGEENDQRSSNENAEEKPIDSEDKKSFVVKVEKVLKIKKSVNTKDHEKNLISALETIPVNKKDGEKKDQNNSNENAEEKSIDSEEVKHENENQMVVE